MCFYQVRPTHVMRVHSREGVFMELSPRLRRIRKPRTQEKHQRDTQRDEMPVGGVIVFAGGLPLLKLRSSTNRDRNTSLPCCFCPESTVRRITRLLQAKSSVSDSRCGRGQLPGRILRCAPILHNPQTSLRLPTSPGDGVVLRRRQNAPSPENA